MIPNMTHKLLIGTFFIGAAQVFAVPVTIHSTGIGSGTDNWYTLSAVGYGSTPTIVTNSAYVIPATSVPIPGTTTAGVTLSSWITGGGSGGQWIAPTPQVDTFCGTTVTPCATPSTITLATTQFHTSAASEVYDYSTTFSLSGLNIASTVITGFWAADGNGTNIIINGHVTNLKTVTNPALEIAGGYASLTAFTLNNGSCIGGSCFVSGLNTITFEVTNGSAETGLRVDFASANADPTPEPATWMSILGGIGALALLRRRQ